MAEDIESNCILYRHCKPWNPNYSSFPDDYFISREPADYSEETAKKLWIISQKLVGKTFEHHY